MGSRYSDSECNLKVEPARFANVIEYGYEREKFDTCVSPETVPDCSESRGHTQLIQVLKTQGQLSAFYLNELMNSLLHFSKE